MDERERLTGFCLTVMRYLLTDSPPVLLKEYEAIPFHVAPISGIREAVSDVLECSVDLQQKQIEELDQALLAQGFPSFSGMRKSRYRRLLRVLDRGHIASDSEWRQISGLIRDLDMDDMSDEERAKFGVLLGEYETRG